MMVRFTKAVDGKMQEFFISEEKIGWGTNLGGGFGLAYMDELRL